MTTQITTHVEDALDRLLEQYRSKPKVVALITALAQHVQKLEDALFPLIQYRQLLSAYGQQLDNLGTVIGVQRNGLSDEQYLVLLIGTIAANYSDTTAVALLNIVQTVYQAAGVFIKDPNSTPGTALPAQVSFGLSSPTLPLDLYALAEQIVFNSVGAAIAVSYISSFPNTGCFAHAGNQSWTRPGKPGFTPDAGNPWPFGFGDLNNPYVGGGYASLVYKDPAE